MEAFGRRDEQEDVSQNKEKIWEVKEIVNSKTVKEVVQYKVQLTGCAKQEDTSQMLYDLSNCFEKLREFWHKFLPKVRD